MPVHIDNVESSVELAGVPSPAGAAGGAPGGGSPPTLPSWQERERQRLVRERAERDAARLREEGVGA